MWPVEVPNVNSWLFFASNDFDQSIFVFCEFRLFSVDLCCASSNSHLVNWFTAIQFFKPSNAIFPRTKTVGHARYANFKHNKNND